MPIYAASRTGTSPACRSDAWPIPAPTPETAPIADRLHELARRVERLGVSGRTDPETILIAKFSIGAELRRLAREIGP